VAYSHHAFPLLSQGKAAIMGSDAEVRQYKNSLCE
jgi:hypothetical protein